MLSSCALSKMMVSCNLFASCVAFCITDPTPVVPSIHTDYFVCCNRIFWSSVMFSPFTMSVDVAIRDTRTCQNRISVEPVSHQQRTAISPRPQGTTRIGCLESPIRDETFDHLRLAFRILYFYSLSFRADTKRTAKLGLKRRQQ